MRYHLSSCRGGNIKKVNQYFVLMTMLLYILLSAQIPYTFDDWDWGLDVGMSHLLTADINSRYVGNFIEVILTRSVVLKNIVLGITFAMIPYYVVKLANKNGINDSQFMWKYMFCNVLFMFMPIDVWAQTYSWVAGFSNFVVSLLFVLLFFGIIEMLSKEIEKEMCIRKYILILVVSICVQLFIENLTVYILITSTFIFMVDTIKNKKVNLKMFVLLIGIIIGTMIMFSSSLYETLITQGEAIDGYRKITIDVSEGIVTYLISIARLFWAGYANGIWSNNFLICFSILLIFATLLYEQQNKKYKIQYAICIMGIFLYGLVFFLGKIRFPSERIIVYITFVFNLFFFVFVIYLLVSNVSFDKVKKIKLLFYWLSAPCVMIPMLIVNSGGPRNYITSMLFLVLFVIELLEDANIRWLLLFKIVCVGLLIASTIRLGIIYYSIGNTNRERLRIIENAIQQEEGTILIPRYEYPEYLCNPDPAEGGLRMYYFKEFYGIPKDIKVTFDD